MPSRRKRKRYRGPAADGGLRGDRTAASPPPADDLGDFAEGVRGQLRGDWPSASRGDLRLLRHAINANWPIPPERCAPLMAAVLSRLQREDRKERLTLAACEVAVAAEEHNQKMQAAALRAAKR